MAGPLQGIRVLDLSRIMAGPWATQVLADLGADVIKVERSGVGDDTRTWGPPFAEHKKAGTRSSGYFLSVNRGKRSIEIDLTDAEGQKTLRSLAARSDILIENFKVGTLERFGLDYESLKEECPRLIYCSITGFGLSGPRKQQPAYDFMIQALGGLMSITGRGDDEVGGGPQKVGVPIVDIMTGMYAAVAVLAALEHRRHSGMGDQIDLAMLDVQAAFLANQAMNYLLTDVEPRRTGNRHPNIQPQNVFACRDGHIAIAVGNDEQFRALARALELPQLAEDERFITNAGRVKNLQALDALLQEAFLSADALDWERKLTALNVPAGKINSIGQALADEQLVHRKMVRSLTRSTGDTVPSVVSPLRFRNAPLEFERAPPDLGADTDAVLRELDLEAGQ